MSAATDEAVVDEGGFFKNLVERLREAREEAAAQSTNPPSGELAPPGVGVETGPASDPKEARRRRAQTRRARRG